MGHHPDTGEELLPVDKEIVLAWRSQADQRKQSENAFTKGSSEAH